MGELLIVEQQLGMIRASAASVNKLNVNAGTVYTMHLTHSIRLTPSRCPASSLVIVMSEQ